MSRWSSLAPSLVLRHARFGFNSDESFCVPKIFAHILNICKYYLWLARNDFHFRHVHRSAVDVLACVCARLRFYLPIFFRHFVSPRCRRYFNYQWGACNIIASCVGNRLVVHV